MANAELEKFEAKLARADRTSDDDFMSGFSFFMGTSMAISMFVTGNLIVGALFTIATLCVIISMIQSAMATSMVRRIQKRDLIDLRSEYLNECAPEIAEEKAQKKKAELYKVLDPPKPKPGNSTLINKPSNNVGGGFCRSCRGKGYKTNHYGEFGRARPCGACLGTGKYQRRALEASLERKRHAPGCPIAGLPRSVLRETCSYCGHSLV